MTQTEADLFLYAIKRNTYRCQVCGETVFPKPIVQGNGVILHKELNTAYKNHNNYPLCNDCVRRLALGGRKFSYA